MVNLSTLSTDVWQVLYDHLQTSTYAISTDNIYSAYPDTGSITYPMVIIYPPIINLKEITTGGGSQSIKECSIVYNIEIYHTSAKNLKSLIDEIINSIKNGKENFSSNGIKNINFTDSDYDWWIETGKKIHMFSLTYTGRLIKK